MAHRREREGVALKWSRSMQKKLDENAHKSHWSEMASHELWLLFLKECIELRDDQDPENVGMEAADVANFAFMYAERRKAEMLAKAGDG